MAKRMLIDAAHPEETRVVVTSGNRLEEFDFESSTKKQVKGNIYLAKVTRVEPSLQAAFVDYGGNRHGFLAFSEIHPDYYRIPIGDRMQHATDSWDGNGGDHDRDNEAGAGEDAGVPLASALPELVQVPHGEAEDDASSDESNGDPRKVTAPFGSSALPDETHPDEAVREDAPWEYRGDGNIVTETSGGDVGGETGHGAQTDAAIPSETAAPADPPFVAGSPATEP